MGNLTIGEEVEKARSVTKAVESNYSSFLKTHTMNFWRLIMFFFNYERNGEIYDEK